MGRKVDTPDLAIARIIERQHGVISTAQLRSQGLSTDAARKRARTGRLHRVHQGVYAVVGHGALSMEGRWMGAVLACGEGAVLSHHSAASLWGLLKPVGGPIDVSVPSAAGRKPGSGIRLHRRSSLTRRSITSRKGIPVTTPARMIADLRGAVPDTWLRRAIRQAEALGLRIRLEEPGEPTKSELEHQFLRLCRRFHLPMPEVNVQLGRRQVDFLWRGQRLVVETDGYRYHRGSQAFEDDHDRDLELRAQGYDVLRFTYRQVTKEPRRVAQAVCASLGMPVP